MKKSALALLATLLVTTMLSGCIIWPEWDDGGHHHHRHDNGHHYGERRW